MRGAFRPREALDRFLFAPTDAESLNLLRFLYCGSVAATIAGGYTVHQGQAESAARALAAGSFDPITLFRLLGIQSMSPSSLEVFRWAAVAALACAAAGLLTRLALASASVSFFLYFGTIFSAIKPPMTDKSGHHTDAVLFVLLVLLVSPGVGLWGADGWLARRRWRLRAPADGVIPAWPVRSVQLLLALAYLGGALCKWHSGPRWADGLTLQALLLQKAAQGVAPSDLTLWLADRRWLCAAFSAGSLLFESTFFVAVLRPRWAPFYALAGLSMHAGIWATMGLNYLKYFGYTYWALLSWPATLGLASRLPAARRELQALASAVQAGLRPRLGTPRKTFALAAVAGLSGINAFGIAAQKEAWPMSTWRFYCNILSPEDVAVYRLRAFYDRRQRWLSQRDLGESPVTLHNTLARNGSFASVECRAAIARLSPEARSGLRRVSLFLRTVVRAGKGGYAFQDRELLRFQPAADGSFSEAPLPAAAVPSRP